MSVSETPPEVPAGVPVQSLHDRRPGDVAAGYRIFADGRTSRLQRGRRLEREEELLSPAQPGRVSERAVAAVPLDDLAGRYEGPAGRRGSRTCCGCRSRYGDGVRAVSVVGDRRVPELDRLTALITAAF